MEWREDRGSFIGKLEPGEEIVASILAFAGARDLQGARLTAIGAVNHARIGFYLPAEKRYAEKELRENMEVVSLLGNLAKTDDGPMVHAHVALGRSDYSLVGGHLFAATVSVTLELVLTPTATALRRTPDPRFDLNLLDLEG